MIFIPLIAAGVIVLCQYLRFHVFANIEPVPEDLRRSRICVRKCYNTGMAFGLFRIGMLPLTLVSGSMLAGICALVYFLAKRKMLDALSIIGFGLLLGGGLSNFIERVKYGQVFDYINFFRAKVKKIRNLIFNVADFSIFLGTIILIISLVKKRS